MAESESKNESKFFIVKIQFNQKILNTKLNRNTDEWRSDLFVNFRNGIKRYLQIEEGDIAIHFEDGNKQIIINNTTELKEWIIANTNADIVHLYVAMNENENENKNENKNKNDDNDTKDRGRRMDECFKSELNEIISFYRENVNKISGKSQCTFSFDYISCSALSFGGCCLNMIRPQTSGEVEREKEESVKISFWRKYCYFYLILSVLNRCIEIKTQIIAELYASNAFEKDDIFDSEYKKLVAIIAKYHELYELDEESEFEAIRRYLKREINIVISDKMIPKQSDSNLKLKISKQSGNKVVKIKIKSNLLQKQTFKKHRIYLLSPYCASINYLCFPQMNGNHFKMHFVDEKNNKYLLYLDVEIAWNTRNNKSVFVTFQIETERGYVQISPKPKLLKKYSGYFHNELHLNSNNESNVMHKAWTYFSKTFINSYDIDDAMMAIITHLMSGIEDYGSYYFVEAVLLSPYWKQYTESMQKRKSLNDCYSMQFIKNVYDCTLSVEQLYDIVESAMMDNPGKGDKEKEMSIKRLNERLRHDIGIGFVYSFMADVRIQLKKTNIATVSIMRMYPIFNFFRYFQTVRNQRYGKRYGQSQIIRFNIKINYKTFLSDKDWRKCEILYGKNNKTFYRYQYGKNNNSGMQAQLN